MPVYRLLYSLLYYLIFPAVLLRLFWRSRQNPLIREHWQQRFGFITLTQSPRIWLHAVSVGETIAAKPLVEVLLTNYPSHKLLISNTTATGYQTSKRLFSESVEHCYFPYDLSGTISRFLKRSNPDLLIIMETEIWPNLLHQCDQLKLPVLLANARLSERSTKGYSRVLSLIKPTLNCVSKIACRSSQDADHFKRLGATNEQLEVAGNIKFDIASETLNSTTTELKKQLGISRPVWVAASTHSGEDEIILACYAQLKQSYNDLVLVLVPRHPERFEAVFKLCESSGYITQRRSANQAFTYDCDIILGDSIGEIAYWYTSADAIFIGGSLVETGGHNPLEAIIYGIPVVSGPAIFNFNDVYGVLYEEQLAWITNDEEALVSKLQQLLGLTRYERSMLKSRAEKALAYHRGAVYKILKLCNDLIARQLV